MNRGRSTTVHSILCLASVLAFHCGGKQEQPKLAPQVIEHADNVWVQRTQLIERKFRTVYEPDWRGANGAIGNAYLFAATHDSSLLRYHLTERPMLDLMNGTWVDDRAWICLAELYWWRFMGKTDRLLVEDAKNRYTFARNEGRLSNHEGFWAWYSWPPNAQVNDRVFTNSNMNQMVSVACMLFEATGDSTFLRDALLAWNGDKKFPGILKTYYKGNGVWKGKPGETIFQKQVPWEGTEYCSIGAALLRISHDPNLKSIIIATAKRITDPKTGWLDAKDFYQLHLDGNGAFVHFLMDAYEAAPTELSEIPAKVEKMLEHVWTNGHGTARVTLHRESDHGIRNGWNPNGGEQGLNVNEVGELHAQSQALRAFGVFAYFNTLKSSN